MRPSIAYISKQLDPQWQSADILPPQWATLGLYPVASTLQLVVTLTSLTAKTDCGGSVAVGWLREPEAGAAAWCWRKTTHVVGASLIFLRSPAWRTTCSQLTNADPNKQISATVCSIYQHSVHGIRVFQKWSKNPRNQLKWISINFDDLLKNASSFFKNHMLQLVLNKFSSGILSRSRIGYMQTIRLNASLSFFNQHNMYRLHFVTIYGVLCEWN